MVYENAVYDNIGYRELGPRRYYDFITNVYEFCQLSYDPKSKNERCLVRR